MPLCESDELIVSLDDMAGELRVVADRRTARIPAGWGIRRLTAALWEEGLALANQGDVDPQSIAGAMATGTHGTGVDLGSLATFARGYRLVNAVGEAHWCDAATNADLYQAQRLSLGLLDRKSVVSGKRVSVRVALGGRRRLKKKKKRN